LTTDNRRLTTGNCSSRTLRAASEHTTTSPRNPLIPRRAWLPQVHRSRLHVMEDWGAD